jgi:O-antigen/teichoic acid export membrane protein
LVSSTILLIRLKPLLNLRTSGQQWRKVGEQHWKYGRWVLASLSLNSITGDIYVPLLSGFSGLAAAGELKALQNFSLPVAQTLSALSLFFLPYTSRVYQERGISGLKSMTWKITCLFGAGSIAYWALLILLSKPVLRSLYGGHYTQLTALIPWLAVSTLLWNLAAVPVIALRAVRSPASVFGAYCASSMVALLVGVPATRALGIRGALMAMILASLAALIATVILLSRKLRDASTARS